MQGITARIAKASHHRQSRRKFHVILDASHAGGVFGSDTQGFAFVFRTDDAPEMDNPIRDNDAPLTCVHPFLFPQLREQLAADRAVLLFVGALRAAARQHFQKVGAADDPDNLSVMYDRGAA